MKNVIIDTEKHTVTLRTPKGEVKSWPASRTHIMWAERCANSALRSINIPSEEVDFDRFKAQTSLIPIIVEKEKGADGLVRLVCSLKKDGVWERASREEVKEFLQCWGFSVLH